LQHCFRFAKKMGWESRSSSGNHWDSLIQRAGQLASRNDAAGELLTFYAVLLGVQKDIYEFLRSRKDWLPTGVFEDDLVVAGEMLPALLSAVEGSGPAELAEEARRLKNTDSDELEGMLLRQWWSPSDDQFFGKAFLQPYARWLAESGGRPLDRVCEARENRCPFCGGKPQVSVLQSRETTSESGGRDLVCATCLTVWPFRRVVCAQCGEERPHMLAYFQAPEIDYIRVEACDTCKFYIKGIDLTRLGLAVPLVDEIYGSSLDLWAREQGYTKIELNLVGL
jgi:formate dehydrogenase accessory protein FdhE